jgi:hypothetical protein
VLHCIGVPFAGTIKFVTDVAEVSSMLDIVTDVKAVVVETTTTSKSKGQATLDVFGVIVVIAGMVPQDSEDVKDVTKPVFRVDDVGIDKAVMTIDASLPP